MDTISKIRNFSSIFKSLQLTDDIVKITITIFEGTTQWQESGAPYYFVYTSVSMAECGFIGTPVITALVDGE